MNGLALYNEIDPQAAEWLRVLILFGHVAPGVVDERSIEDLEPDYVRQFTQVHLFSGIGVWSLALRRAGWPDDRPVWTGSCPCQPFSAAGKGGGFDDERHLWPAFHHLIRECRPDVVLGEQVASKDGLAWLDLVSSDLEGEGYAVGAADTCAAGFGAPHIRQRLYWSGVREGLEHAASDRRLERRTEPSGWGAAGGCGDGFVADTDDEGLEGRRAERQRARECVAGSSGLAGGLADAEGDGHERGGELDQSAGREGAAHGEHDRRLGDALEPARQRNAGSLPRTEEEVGREDGQQHGDQPDGPEHASAGLGGLADTYGRDASAEREQRGGQHGQQPEDASSGDGLDRPGPTNGLWRDADWLGCRDGKWRPVEPGTFPLAHGATARVGRLRGYGNAIVSAQAQGFVEAVMAAL